MGAPQVVQSVARHVPGRGGPGFVDLQVNGAVGIDFAAPGLSATAARTAAHHVLASGTAAFLPTLVSCSDATYRENLPVLANLVKDSAWQGRVIGLHLEGPFLAPDPRVLGAHRRQHLRLASPAYLESLQRLADGTIRLLTLSAEIDGAFDLIRAARSLGIAVSIGHSWATAEQLASARDAGACALTHFGNAIPQTLPRHDNPLWASLATAGLTALLVVDGLHVPRSFVQAVVRTMGLASVALVSDSAPLTGLPPGDYQVFEQSVQLRADGAIWNSEEQHFCGSSSSLLEVVNRALEWGIVDVQGAWELAYHNPLALIGLSHCLWHSDERVILAEGQNRFDVVSTKLTR